MRRALLILAVIVISVLVYFSLSGKVSESVITDENYAYEVERWLSPGWNMGSQLDAVKDCYAYEKAWRGYLCGQGFFDTVAAAGIKTIRIPVTWIGNIGPAPEYRLDSARLARVREVVGWPTMWDST